MIKIELSRTLGRQSSSVKALVGLETERFAHGLIMNNCETLVWDVS